jgi:hypothetical protein
MATELPKPCETLSVAEILNALGINHGIAAEDPQLYFVIPGRDGPRWLIPERPCASASVLSAWHPYDLSSRMKWFVLRMAARAGVLRLLPAVSSVTASRRGALRWFERCGIRSQTGEMVILAGSPSPDWKLITFLLDDAHRIASVLKVGLTDGGGVSVLHEAKVLGKLAPYSWAPKILSVHSDLRAASQEYVNGAMPGRGFRPEYMDCLCRLPQSGGCKTLAVVANEMEKRLSPFKAQLDEMAPDLLDRALSCMDIDIAVPTMLVHGDFAPWNLRKNPEAGYVLIDWEWANFAGLPAYDIFHFQFNDMPPFDQGRFAPSTFTGWISTSNCCRGSRSLTCSISSNPIVSIAVTSTPPIHCINWRPSPMNSAQCRNRALSSPGNEPCRCLSSYTSK